MTSDAILPDEEPTKGDLHALKLYELNEGHSAHLVNLIAQRAAERPGTVVQAILPDDCLDQKEFDEELLDEDGNPDLEKILPNSDENPIEYVYTRDATGRVVNVDARYKPGRGKESKSTLLGYTPPTIRRTNRCLKCGTLVLDAQHCFPFRLSVFYNNIQSTE